MPLPIKKIAVNVIFHIALLYVNFGLFYSIVACIHICHDETFLGRMLIFITTLATWPAHFFTTRLFY